MAALKWDQEGQKYIEAGTDKGVLYVYNPESTNTHSKYAPGVAWSGLTSVSESPSGGDSNKQYADNTIYANLRGTEEFGGTIEAFMYPDEWAECNGQKRLQTAPGLTIGQQSRKTFGFCFRTLIGSDTDELGQAGYKLHLIYGATVSPSESSYETINESPEGMTFSWEFDTVPVEIEGYPELKKVSQLIVDSRTATPAKLTELETKLYGGDNADPYLPMPAEVISTLAP